MLDPSTEFDGLRALFINCTLKRSPEVALVLSASAWVMLARGVVGPHRH
jgi:hypothetical protein